MSVLSKVPTEELLKFSRRLMPGTPAHEELIEEIARRRRRGILTTKFIAEVMIMAFTIMTIAFVIKWYIV